MANNNPTQNKNHAGDHFDQPLTAEEVEASLARLDPAWQSEDMISVSREITGRNFLDVVKLISQIAELAEAEDHHPDLYLHNYKQLRITLSTHSVGGLSEKDFILAAKIDELLTAATPGV